VWGEAGSAVCSVRDEGPGLSEADLARLFQKGVRLAPQPTAGEPSTGYGLAVAKSLVDKLGGEIWCLSKVGEGSSFQSRPPACAEHLEQDGQAAGGTPAQPLPETKAGQPAACG